MTIMAYTPSSTLLRKLQEVSKFKVGLGYTEIPHVRDENILEVNCFDGLDPFRVQA